MFILKNGDVIDATQFKNDEIISHYGSDDVHLNIFTSLYIKYLAKNLSEYT